MAFAATYFDVNSWDSRGETKYINTQFVVPPGKNIFSVYAEGFVTRECIGSYSADLNISSSEHNYNFLYGDGEAGCPADATRSYCETYIVNPGEVLNISGFIYACMDEDLWNEGGSTCFFVKIDSSYDSSLPVLPGGYDPEPIEPAPIVSNPVMNCSLAGGGTGIYGNNHSFNVSAYWSGGDPNPKVTGVALYTADGTYIGGGSGPGSYSCKVPIPANKIERTAGSHSYTTSVYAVITSDNGTSHKTNSVPVTVTYDVTPAISYSPVGNTSIDYGQSITTNLTAAYDLAHLPFEPKITRVEIKEPNMGVVMSRSFSSSSVNENFVWMPELTKKLVDTTRGRHNYVSSISATVYTDTGTNYDTISIPFDIAYRVDIEYRSNMKEGKSQAMAVEDMNKRYITSSNRLSKAIKEKFKKPALSEDLYRKILDVM